MINSRFIGNTDLTSTNVPGFTPNNDPNAPNFRPDQAAQQQLDAMADEEEVEDDEKTTLIQAYFTTNRTNAEILAGPQAEITGRALLQLRVTMTTQQVLDAVEAKQGKGAIKTGPLHRRFDPAFEKVAGEEGFTVDELKTAFNKVSDVSRARKTGWKRPDASTKKKDDVDDDDEDEDQNDGAPGPRRGQGAKSGALKGKTGGKESKSGQSSTSKCKGKSMAKA